MPATSPAARRPGRPRSASAASHAAIMEATYDLLKERSLDALTLDAVAKRAGVGKPTLYRWWPTKTALVLAMFQERLVPDAQTPRTGSAEALIRRRVRQLIEQFGGMYGKVMADLIAGGQADPDLLRQLHEHLIRPRRAATAAEIERGKADGEFRADLDPELLMDAVFGPLYYRLVLRFEPLTAAYGDHLVDLALRGCRI